MKGVEDLLAPFKYASITSADITQGELCYKNLIWDKRHSYKFDQIQKIIVSQCNNVIKTLCDI